MNHRITFPELHQFLAGYFYPGWPADYAWDAASSPAAYSAVVRHFKAVNPPLTVNKVRIELGELARLGAGEETLDRILRDLGCAYDPASESLTRSQWLARLTALIDESSTMARVLREIR